MTTQRGMRPGMENGGPGRSTLTDNWQIRPLETFHHGDYPGSDEDWLPATVPGHWQQIPELAQHVGKVVYRCRFSYAANDIPPAQRIWLRINGAFYISRPYLNRVDLGAHTGYFIPFEHEVTPLLHHENTLLIEVDCPEERNKIGKRMITGVFSHWDCFDPTANPGGIWLPVELHTSGPLRLQNVLILTEAIAEDSARLHFTLHIDAAAAGRAALHFTFTPRTFSGKAQNFTKTVTVRAGQHELDGKLTLHDPHLWWTHDLGRPDLYNVRVELHYDDELSDSADLVIGVRTFELREWIPYLNGERFLIKGNNYPPGDVRIATMTRERCDRDLELATACHMNFLRIHAHVDHPAFYAAADAAGVLLWQDFPLQWHYDQSVLPEALRQVRAMVHVLGNHPSIGNWCMHNEAVPVDDTAHERLLPRLRAYQNAFGFSWNRDVMDTQLKAEVERHDATRPVIRSSGEIALPPLHEGTDAHTYFGWYSAFGTLAFGELLLDLFPGNARFVTEFGAQSFPNLESCLRFMPERLDDAAIARLEARHGFQGEIMSHWIPWREAGRLSEVIRLSQDYQSFINRYYIDRLRLTKYRPTGGIVPFMFVDPFPAILWSVVDYWRVPKRSYYAMQTAFSPQYAFTIFDHQTYPVGKPIELPVYAVNDGRQPVPGAMLRAVLADPVGTKLDDLFYRLDLSADCETQTIDELRFIPTYPGRYILTISLSNVPHPIEHAYTIDVA
jgi:beta-mannosidase